MHTDKVNSVVQHVVDGKPGTSKYAGGFPNGVQNEVDTDIHQLEKTSDPGCLAH